MSDFHEIDFIKINKNNNADAIAMRYVVNGKITIHIVDAGFSDTGLEMVDHIKKYYDNPFFIDHVVLTHPDEDHIGGMVAILENFDVGILWMNCPWDDMGRLMEYAPRFRNIDNLEKRLRENYQKLDELEKLAKEKNIEIKKPLTGSIIGAFTVMSPSKDFYNQMIIESRKSKELDPTAKIGMESYQDTASFIKEMVNEDQKKIKWMVWGEEKFPTEHTDTENETSVIQFATLNNSKILLTGDAGKRALEEAIEYDNRRLYKCFPVLDLFQIPHHGSRRNVDSDVLDKILGSALPTSSNLNPTFSAIASVSSVTAQQNRFPREMVVRAIEHRGGKVFTNVEGYRHGSPNAPTRQGWVVATPEGYPYYIEG